MVKLAFGESFEAVIDDMAQEGPPAEVLLFFIPTTLTHVVEDIVAFSS